MLAILLSTSIASAAIDPACQEVADQGVPDGYSEQGQQDWLLNYFSMVGAFSPLHGVIPHKPGTGAMGVELAVIPPVSCEHRLVLNYTKTGDTNKLPVLPRPRVSFAMPSKQVGTQVIVPYAGLGYVPPLPLPDSASLDGGSMQNTIASIEAGFGAGNADLMGLQYGARFHATVMKTVAEIATPFDSNATVSYKDAVPFSCAIHKLCSRREIATTRAKLASEDSEQPNQYALVGHSVKNIELMAERPFLRFFRAYERRVRCISRCPVVCLASSSMLPRFQRQRRLPPYRGVEEW